MSIVGVLWVILLVLKAVGVIHTGWLILIFWPILFGIFVWLVIMILALFGVTVGALVSRR